MNYSLEARALAVLIDAEEPVYCVEVRDALGLEKDERTLGKVRYALDKLERAGKARSRLVKPVEHGARTGLPRRYFEAVR